MVKRAVLYARVSSDDRTKTGGANLRAQLEMCREYAQERGYIVVAELAEDDRGASGAIFDLRQLNKALEMAREGEYDVLIARELDRLSRDLTKQLVVEQELKDAGVVIEYALYDFPDTPEGRLNKNMRAMLAEYEREKIKQRMIRGKIRKIRSGDTINHGHPPFGYRNVIVDGKRRLAVDEEEAKIVRLIFQLYLEGDGENPPMSIRAIMKYLSDLKIPTYSDRRGKGDCTRKIVSGYGKWRRSSVASILSNTVYTGTWLYGHKRWAEEDWIPVTVPVIIEEATFQAAQQRREKRRHKGGKAKYNYLLAGRIACGYCERAMIGSVNTNAYGWKGYYYRCQAINRHDKCEMGYRSFRVEFIDDEVWKWIRDILSNDERLKVKLDDYKTRQEKNNRPLQERLDAINTLISQYEDQLSRLLDLYLGGDFSKEVLTEKRTQIEQALTGLRREQQKIDAQLSQTFSEAQVTDIVEFAQAIRQELTEADQDFTTRRRLIELLDVTGRAVIEEGKRVVYLHCVLGDKRVMLSNRCICAYNLCRDSCCTSAQRTYRTV